MKRKRVLVISNKVDVHTDSVIDALYKIGAEVIRLNTEDFRKNKYFLHLNNLEVVFNFATPEYRVVSCDNVYSVYVRRITSIDVSDVDSEYQQLVRDESQVVLDSLYALLENARWLDCPQRRLFAANKINQLLAARTSGFSIPPSIITNLGDSAKEFIKLNSSIFKTLKYPIVDFGDKGCGMINTTKITLEDIDRICNDVPVTANFFQHYMDKKYELRIHVIGKEIVAVKIDSQSNTEAIVDWRKANFNDLDYEVISLPDIISKSILKFMNIMKLNFGIIDMIVTPAGEYYFLELNPNGNWTWLESHINESISSRIAQWLIS